MHIAASDIAEYNRLKPLLLTLQKSNRRPDAYAISDNQVLLIEHFQFDNTKVTAKGSKQQIVSQDTNRRIKERPLKVVREFVDKAGVLYCNNFESAFKKHAKKIDEYKIELAKIEDIRDKQIIVGWFYNRR